MRALSSLMALRDGAARPDLCDAELALGAAQRNQALAGPFQCGYTTRYA
jgi:hypothetical protein